MSRWAGGRIVLSRGYIGIFMPGHPRVQGRNYVLEHVLIVERAIGHALPARAEIHHVDENPANNAPGNLVVCPNHSYHMLLHRRQRAFDACGDANAHKCGICHGYGDQSDIVAYTRLNGDHRSYHRQCKVKDSSARRAALRSAKEVKRLECYDMDATA